MRVMFVSHCSVKYGAVRSLLDLIDGLLHKGVECYVIIPAPGPIEDELKKMGVEYSVVPVGMWVSSGNSFWKAMLQACLNTLMSLTSLAIAKKAWAWRADVIYTNSIVTPVGALAAKLLRKPHIWHIREFCKEDYNLSFNLGMKRTMKLVNSLSSHVIAISEAIKDKYAEYLPEQKIRVIYNPVAFKEEFLKPATGLSTKKREEFIVTILGLLHDGKGQIDAVRAIGELIKLNIKVRLRIIGDGDKGYIKRLKEEVAKARIEAHVEFLGYLDNPTWLVNEADAILVCSRCEAFGRVTAEAMLAKKPVIGARSGATKELIQEHSNGLLYEPGNYRELAEKIQYLMDNRKVVEIMGLNGHRFAAEHFTIERYLEEIYTVLREAVKEGS